jgi:hypothetical protein
MTFRQSKHDLCYDRSRHFCFRFKQKTEKLKVTGLTIEIVLIAKNEGVGLSRSFKF